MQQVNTLSLEEWSFKEFVKWVATIKGMSDDVGPDLVRNDANGAAFIVMGQEDLKEIGVTKAGPLSILLK